MSEKAGNSLPAETVGTSTTAVTRAYPTFGTRNNAGMHAPNVWASTLATDFSVGINLHHNLLRHSLEVGGDQNLGFAEFKPLIFIRTTAEPTTFPASSSRLDPAAAAAGYYRKLEERLTELEAFVEDDEPPVERGALVSARKLLQEAKQFRVAPPELTWQGGEAIIMLWAFSSTVLAVTVTDGEIGYVIRRDRKQVALKHSIPLAKFNLLEASA